MLIKTQEKLSSHLSRFIPLTEIDSNSVDRARGVFEQYQENYVIVGSKFDDSEWKLTNQKQNVNLSLSFSGKEEYCIAEWLGCDYGTYCDCVKAYAAFNLGKCELPTLQEIVRTLRKLSDMTADETVSVVKNVHHILAFLRLLPNSTETRDAVIERLEEQTEQKRWNKQKSEQRHLADFNSYLKFNEILCCFWQRATDSEKLFYFPLYFWWNITAILPLRPTEFLLTPRNCLQGNVLTIRRTKLKGGTCGISYRIDEDYELHQYSITDRLSEELRWYLNATESMKMTDIDTLFLQKPHFGYFGWSGFKHNRYYTYACLRHCLSYFYDEVVSSSEHNIKFINLGDTRHLAMINLIVSGGSPTICKELAGHSDIEISSHYYSNISEFVECATLNHFRKTKGKEAALTGEKKYPLSKPKDMYRTADGWCDYSPVKDGDVSECLKVVSNKGHIGECMYCSHFWSDKQGIHLKFYDTEISKQQVDMDSLYLIRMIELVRKGLGYNEDIGAAVLRLQNSCDRYGNCLWEKYAKAGEIV